MKTIEVEAVEVEVEDKTLADRLGTLDARDGTFTAIGAAIGAVAYWGLEALL